MTVDTREHERTEAYATEEREDASVGNALRGVWTEFRFMAREHAYLAVLEAQRAGLHLAYVLGAVLVVSVLLVTAWLALVTALIVWMTDHLSWPAILAIVAVINLVGAAGVGWWVRRLYVELPFSATLRQLAAGRREITTRPAHAQSS